MKTKPVQKVIIVLFLSFVLLVTVSPLLLLIINSLKSQREFLVNPFGLPTTLALANFPKVWITGGYSRAYLNSLLIAVCSVTIVVSLGGLCAFSLAKFRFRGSNVVLTYFILSMSIPVSLFLVPIFFIFKNLGLLDTIRGLIIVYGAIFLPFNIVFLRSFFMGIPDSVLESAKIDGCSDLGLFFRMVIPLSRPAFLTVALLVTLWTWNEFFFANAFITTNVLRPVSTRFLAFTGTYTSDWTLICAAGIISILPIMIFYIIFQRNFIEGLMSGSIKG